MSIHLQPELIEKVNKHIVTIIKMPETFYQAYKCLENSEAMSVLQKAASAYKSSLHQLAITYYKNSLALVKDDFLEKSLQTIVQYLICKCQVETSQLACLIEAESSLINLIESTNDKYPMLYFQLGNLYKKAFCFKEAEKLTNICLSILSSCKEIPACLVPTTSDVIPESNHEELSKLLMDLKEECSGWHRPDAICFMKNCKANSMHNLLDREIFVKSPAFNGLVVVSCNSSINPCVFNFHISCWKAKKEELSPSAKLSDKDFLSWKCFTPNCENLFSDPSVISKIEILNSDNSIKSRILLPEKAGKQQPTPSKGAVRKQPPKVAPKITRPRNIQSVFSNSSTRIKNDYNKKIKSKDEMMLISHLIKLIQLRNSNYGIKSGKDWRPDLPYYGDSGMIIYDEQYPDLINSGSEELNQKKSFLYSYFYSYVSSNAPVKKEALLKKWEEAKTLISDCDSVLYELSCPTIFEFLLKSMRFSMVGGYICTPATLPEAYKRVNNNVCGILKCLMSKEVDADSSDDDPVDEEFLNSLKSFDAAGRLGNGEDSRISDLESSIIDEDLKGGDLESRKNYGDLKIGDSEDGKVDESLKVFDLESSEIDEDLKIGYLEDRKIDEDLKGEDLKDKKIDEDLKGEDLEDKKIDEDLKGEDLEDKKIDEDLKGEDLEDRKIDEDLKAEDNLEEINLQYDNQEGPEEKIEDDSNDFKVEKDKDLSFNAETCDFVEEKLVIENENDEEIPEPNNDPVEEKNSEEKLPGSKSEIEDQCEDENKPAERKFCSKTCKRLAENLQRTRKDFEDSKAEFLNGRVNFLKNMLYADYIIKKNAIKFTIHTARVEFAIVDKLQSLLIHSVGAMLPVTESEWTAPLKQLEKLSLALDRDYYSKLGLISDAEFCRTAEGIACVSSELPALPKRDLPALVELAFNMHRNYFCRVEPGMNRPQAPFPPGFNGLFPNPVMLQQPQFWQPPVPLVWANPHQFPPEIPGQVHPGGCNSKLFDGGNVFLQNNGARQWNSKEKSNFEDSKSEFKNFNGKKDEMKEETHAFKYKESPETLNNDKVDFKKGEDFFKELEDWKLQWDGEMNYLQDRKEREVRREFGEEKMLTSEEEPEPETKEMEDGDFVREEMRRKSSMDKLMKELRARNKGVLEYDLLCCIQLVRKKFNNSLTGLTLVKIIEEVEKRIPHREKIQLSNYNNRFYSTVRKSAKKSEKIKETPVPSSRSPVKKVPKVAKNNPWATLDNLQWINEPSDENECIICMETIVKFGKVPSYTLRCQHTFHKKCIKSWFDQNQSCPTCRIHSTIDDEFPPLS